MKLFLTLLSVMTAQLSVAGIFDGSPLDPRNPVQICQSYVSNNFSSDPQFLSACGRITTRFAYKCLENVSTKNGLSLLTMSTCSFVNTSDSLSAVEAVSKSFNINNEILVALSFADTKPESTCVKGLVDRSTTISIQTVMKCNQETFVDYGWRWAKAIAM